MAVSTVDSVRGINDKLRTVLLGWQRGPEAGAVTPQVFAELLAELRRATELLRSITSHAAPDPTLESEIVEYYRNVMQLEKVLPTIQGRLLSEKSRIENARAHLSAAAAWADARKKTL